jgi:hypothetical protein
MSTQLYGAGMIERPSDQLVSRRLRQFETAEFSRVSTQYLHRFVSHERHEAIWFATHNRGDQIVPMLAAPQDNSSIVAVVMFSHICMYGLHDHLRPHPDSLEERVGMMVTSPLINRLAGQANRFSERRPLIAGDGPSRRSEAPLQRRSSRTITSSSKLRKAQTCGQQRGSTRARRSLRISNSPFTTSKTTIAILVQNTFDMTNVSTSVPNSKSPLRNTIANDMTTGT